MDAVIRCWFDLSSRRLVQDINRVSCNRCLRRQLVKVAWHEEKHLALLLSRIFGSPLPESNSQYTWRQTDCPSVTSTRQLHVKAFTLSAYTILGGRPYTEWTSQAKVPVFLMTWLPRNLTGVSSCHETRCFHNTTDLQPNAYKSRLFFRSELQNIVIYLLKARIVQPPKTAISRERLCKYSRY